MFEEIVLKSMPLIKEAFLPNYREDDLLSFQRANKDLEGMYNYWYYTLQGVSRQMFYSKYLLSHILNTYAQNKKYS